MSEEAKEFFSKEAIKDEANNTRKIKPHRMPKPDPEWKRIVKQVILEEIAKVEVPKDMEIKDDK